MTDETEPHVLLGVSEEAGSAEIRRAYRRLALAVHPDRNPDPGACEAFIALHVAYRALMTQRKREMTPVSPATVTDNVARAAAEVRRRRARPSVGAKAWQLVRLPLTQPLGSRIRGFVGKKVEYAVEFHWTGLIDLRYDLVVAWDEIAGVKEQDGLLDVVLSQAGSVRLWGAAELFENGTIYRFPLGEPSRLAGLIRQQIGA